MNVHTASAPIEMTIFDLRKAYHTSLSNIRGWLGDSSLSGRLTVLDRLSILDAWHQETRHCDRDQPYVGRFS